MSTSGGSKRNFDIKEEDHNNDIPQSPLPGLKRHDSLDIESSRFPDHHDRHNTEVSIFNFCILIVTVWIQWLKCLEWNWLKGNWRAIVKLAFQSIGVVYGDIGTSPLYVYASTFFNGIKHEDDILGVLSIIFYTITLIPVIKYVMIVLHANDNGDGTYAFHFLPC